MYKDKARVDVKILSITFISNVAQVRFSTEKKATDGTNTDNSPVQKWIATIGFKFSAGMMTDQQRLLNPLGFKSISYRVDPEVLK
jgi:type IV secretion system protein VirB8